VSSQSENTRRSIVGCLRRLPCRRPHGACAAVPVRLVSAEASGDQQPGISTGGSVASSSSPEQPCLTPLPLLLQIAGPHQQLFLTWLQLVL
ncbi:unnamed protein product, partial [Polarella glacialis]